MRRFRLRAIWLLVLPFLWYSRPTSALLFLGGPIAVVGLLIRAWAAGSIMKERELATSGPYAHMRHPLYIGSLFVGLGVTLAGGHWIWPTLFLGFYAAAYGATIAGEAELLDELFGEAYRDYAANVPALAPQLRPFRPAASTAKGGFRFSQYRRNKEWEALLVAAGAFGFLTAKAVLG